nr:GNAT family N-acetyltransferase [Angustibacter aerolatus]
MVPAAPLSHPARSRRRRTPQSLAPGRPPGLGGCRHERGDRACPVGRRLGGVPRDPPRGAPRRAGRLLLVPRRGGGLRRGVLAAAHGPIGPAARRGSTANGSASCRSAPPPSPGCRSLFGMWVPSQRRGAGIAWRLTDAAARWTRRQGGRGLRLWVSTDNGRAVAFFSSLRLPPHRRAPPHGGRRRRRGAWP